MGQITRNKTQRQQKVIGMMIFDTSFFYITDISPL